MSERTCTSCASFVVMVWGCWCNASLPPWVERTENDRHAIDGHPELAATCTCFSPKEVGDGPESDDIDSPLSASEIESLKTDMRYIIVPIESGERECGNDCNWEVRRYGAKCRIFGGMISECADAPLLRLPACLAAEAKLAALVNEAKNILEAYWDMSPLEYANSRGLPFMSEEEGDRI